MALWNGSEEFGLVTRILHWLTMLLVLGMLALGTRLESIEPGLANLWLYGLHKTTGLAVLALVLVRLGWHLVSPPPRPLGPPGPLMLLARAVHWGFYVLLVVIPLSGWAGSSATGIDVMIADRWTLPPLVEPSEAGEAFWFGVHGVLTKLLIALILLHVAGAVKRAMAGDGTIRRMIRGRV
ncbi:MAG: cytochrome b [Tabrizicola sp.]|nr:cytochrome b [Tabrizicola sp.]